MDLLAFTFSFWVLIVCLGLKCLGESSSELVWVVLVVLLGLLLLT